MGRPGHRVVTPALALATLCGPASLGSFADRLSAGGTQLSLGLYLFRGTGLRPGFGPSCLLGSRDPLPSGGAHLPSRFCRFSSNGRRRAVALQQLTEFIDLRIDAPFLRFEAFDRGVDDFSCELLRHLNVVRRDHSSTDV